MKKRIAEVLRVDRALRLVWHSGRGWTVGSLVIMVLQGLLPLLALYLMKLIVDEVTGAFAAPDKSAVLSHVFLLIGCAGAVALLTVVFQQTADWIREAQSLVVTDHVYDLLHEQSVKLDLEYYENPAYLDTLHRAQAEGPYRPTRILNGLMSVGQSGISLIAIAGLLLMFHWSVPIILVSAAIPGVIVRILYSRRNYQWHQQNTQFDRKSRYYNWMLTGDAHAKEIRLYNLAGLFMERFSRLRKKLRVQQIRMKKGQARAEVAAQFVATLLVFGCFAFIAKRTIMGIISLGEMVMFFQAFQRGLGNMKGLFSGMASLYEDSLFLTNLYAFLDLEPTVKQPLSPLPVPKPIKQGITFSRVGFRYPAGRETVLKHISFSIAPQEVVAIVGENGSGKTTLVKLLCRLYDPDSGKILIDDTPLDSFDKRSLQRNIGVVFQDYVKYFLPVKENIGFGKVDDFQDINKIKEAAGKSGIHDTIAAFPDGYDTVLGKWFEKGEEISIGQWQKIAIARAFFRDAQFIVLDEPAGALDVKTEFEIFNRFHQLVQGKSAIIISHRLSTVKMADRILLLENGHITEQGSHDTLMKQDGTYAALFRMQGGLYNRSGGTNS